MGSVVQVSDYVVQQIQRASHRHNAGCYDCEVADFCFPYETAADNVDFEQQIIECEKNSEIYHEGKACRFLYSVREGCVKTLKITSDGSEQIMGFYFAGEVFGFDGMAAGQHELKAVAIGGAKICRVPVDVFLQNKRHSERLLHLMSEDYMMSQRHLSLINKNQADVRIASLLLDIVGRVCRNSLSDLSFSFSMTRTDVANYLGLTVETVSRLMKKMEREGLFRFDGNFLVIEDLPKLQREAYF